MTATPTTSSAPPPITPIGGVVAGRFSYFVPGLFTAKDDPRSWYLQAQAWMHANSYGTAAGFGYFCDAIGGVVARDYEADLVAGDLLNASVAGFSPLVAAGHSNGCQILLNALRRHPDLHIDALHLIAAAAPHDCDASGLNALAALPRPQISRVFLYVSPSDDVLVLGGAMPGYGNLGRTGPTNVSPALSRILTVVPPAQSPCGHSDWVTRDFYTTMQRIATTPDNGADRQ